MDLRSTRLRGDADLAITSFVAARHPTESCGTNGLPLTPNSVAILGQSQRLRLLAHKGSSAPCRSMQNATKKQFKPLNAEYLHQYSLPRNSLRYRVALQNLCTHLDCVRGKHERIVLVSDCYADSLADDGAAVRDVKEGEEFILKVERGNRFHLVLHY